MKPLFLYVRVVVGAGERTASAASAKQRDARLRPTANFFCTALLLGSCPAALPRKLIHAAIETSLTAAVFRLPPSLPHDIQAIAQAVDESVAEPAACWGKARPLQPPAQPYAREYHNRENTGRVSTRDVNKKRWLPVTV